MLTVCMKAVWLSNANNRHMKLWIGCHLDDD